MEQLDVVVIGAGVVGLAVARAFSLRGRSVVVLEENDAIGMETSSRSSEVIHAGIYYPKNSLKARFCVEGKARLYEYCKERNIAHSNLGKLIVAVEADEASMLEGYIKSAENNGVTDLRRLSQTDIKSMEPTINAMTGVFSPSTGIVDSHALMQAYLTDIEMHGGHIIYRSPVLSGAASDRGYLLDVGGVDPVQICCRLLVNAAGLNAVSLAGKLGVSSKFLPKAYFASGHYYCLDGKPPFNHLVYPTAGNAGLGVHVTLDMGGQARFGPDVRWIESPDYTFDDSRRSDFVQAIRRYYPDLNELDLRPGYVGVRPKISGPSDASADFVLQAYGDHGVAGLVNLLGIESPGLTASLALADAVVTLDCA